MRAVKSVLTCAGAIRREKGSEMTSVKIKIKEKSMKCENLMI